MIDFEKNIICENEKEFLFIKKKIFENGFKYDEYQYVSFPGFFHRYINHPEKFNFYKYRKNKYNDCKDFITAKQIIREIKLNKIND